MGDVASGPIVLRCAAELWGLKLAMFGIIQVQNLLQAEFGAV